MIDYPETIDLTSYIQGYEEYCDEIERKNQNNYLDDFTEEDDKRIDEARLEEIFSGETDL